MEKKERRSKKWQQQKRWISWGRKRKLLKENVEKSIFKGKKRDILWKYVVSKYYFICPLWIRDCVACRILKVHKRTQNNPSYTDICAQKEEREWDKKHIDDQRKMFISIAHFVYANVMWQLACHLYTYLLFGWEIFLLNLDPFRSIHMRIFSPIGNLYSFTLHRVFIGMRRSSFSVNIFRSDESCTVGHFSSVW